jgi:hypothetical protein
VLCGISAMRGDSYGAYLEPAELLLGLDKQDFYDLA